MTGPNVSLFPVKDLVPNDFNPNRVHPAAMVKLRRNVLSMWNAKGTVPPVITRDLDDPSKQEIIDGYHRYLIFKEEGIPEIPVMRLGDVSRADAMRMCVTLNYLRGDPEPKSYVALVEELLHEQDWTMEEAAEYLPESAEALDDMVSLLGVGDLGDSSFTGDDDDFGLEPPSLDDGDQKGDPYISVSLNIPVGDAMLLESTKALLLDYLFDPSSSDPPDVDSIFVRLTCRWFQRNIKNADDVFSALRGGKKDE